MKMNLLLVILVSLLAACESGGSSDGVTPVRVTYLALGDSYTIGQGVSPNLRWPQQLVDSLNEGGAVVDSLRIIAQTGWRTDNLSAAMDEAGPLEAELVSLLIGVNDQFQGVDTLQFQSNFNALLERAIGIAGGIDRVFVVSIPDYGVTPFGAADSSIIADEIDAYNRFIGRRCFQPGIPFVDVTSISREMGDSQGSLANDQLHPSGAQYRLWMQAIFPVASAIIDQE